MNDGPSPVSCSRFENFLDRGGVFFPPSVRGRFFRLLSCVRYSLCCESTKQIFKFLVRVTRSPYETRCSHMLAALRFPCSFHAPAASPRSRAQPQPLALPPGAGLRLRLVPWTPRALRPSWPPQRCLSACARFDPEPLIRPCSTVSPSGHEKSRQN